MSRTTTAAPEVKHAGLNGWVEACLFAIALSVLNVTYGIGYQIGAHPVAFLVYAMPIAALTLLAFTGAGPNWRPIIGHPLSYAVGGGIIAMEAVYYVLLNYATPTDGSLLVRLNVPAAALFGVLLGRWPAALGVVGHVIVVAAIAWYALTILPGDRTMSLLLAGGCGLIMSLRAFATEFHPWNRAARTIAEKMQVTGLVLGVTSLMGTVIVFGLMALVANGTMLQPAWLPQMRHFLHLPTIALALFLGTIVLTAMQYLGFSVVVKIQAQNFVATTALIPLVTLVMQIAAVHIGILAPVPLEWRVLPAMLAVAGGILLVIWSARQRT